MAVDLSSTEWERLAAMRRDGKLTPAQEHAWQVAVDAGAVPQEAIKGFPGGQEAIMRAAQPEEVEHALRQPPLPPTLETWGQTAIQYGLPIAAAFLGGGPAAQGGLAALGSFLAHAPFFPPDPRTDPYGAMQASEAAKTALRTGAETTGAAYGARAIPSAPKGAGILRRGATMGGRAVTTGAGAGAGALAVEPVAPTEQPVPHALGVGVATAGGQATGETVAGFGKRTLAPFAKTLTESGKKAADVLKRRGLAIPASVTESTTLKTAEFLGTESLGGGTLVRQARTRAEHEMTGAINTVIDNTKIPATSRRLAQLSGGTATAPDVRTMYRQLDALVTKGTARPLRPVAMPSTLPNDTQSAMVMIPSTNPIAPTLRALSRTTGTLPLQTAETLHGRLQRFLTTSGGSLAVPARRALENVRLQLRGAIDSPAIIDMAPLQTRLAQWGTRAAPWLPPDMHAVLSRVSTTPGRLSFQEAQDLRSSLLALGRSIEGGGQFRAPTAGGQRPLAGTGARFAARIGAEARSLAQSVDTAMARGARQLGPDVEQYWRHANTAMRVRQQSEWLQNLLAKPGILDPQTGIYNGRAVLRALATVRRPGGLATARPQTSVAGTLQEGVTPATLANIKEFANALEHVQRGGEGSPRTMAHMLLHRGIPLIQGALGLGAAGATMVHPGLGAAGVTMAITPTALGFILQSPRMTRYLTVGLRAPEGSRAAAEAMGRLVAVLQAEGLLSQAAPESPGSPLEQTPPE